jgi:K+-transporting ATPase ATPase C chain
MFLSQLRAALVVLTALTLVTGVAYPLAVTGVSKGLLAHRAEGSMVASKSGKVVGSELVGQPFDDPKYFWGRLSATLDSNNKPLPYNGGSSAGSNLGPTNPTLRDNAKARIDALRAVQPGLPPVAVNGEDPPDDRPIPIDLVTASGSGLDPHISPAAAEYQIPRVAKARKLPEAQVRALVLAHTEGRTLGFLGEPRVNVLTLNVALDDL